MKTSPEEAATARLDTAFARINAISDRAKRFLIIHGVVSGLGCITALLLILQGPFPIPDAKKSLFMGALAFAQVGFFAIMAWHRSALNHEKLDWHTLLTENLSFLFFSITAIFVCVAMLVPLAWLFATTAFVIGTIHAGIQMRALQRQILTVTIELKSPSAAPVSNETSGQ